MADKFLNPITMSFELLERYKKLLRDTLDTQGLQAGDIDEILQSMQVDRGLFLSLNRKYKKGQASFRQFCADHSLAPQLPDCLGWFGGQRLYIHQEEAVRTILADETTVVSTGTGSGKTEAFLIPILNHCLKYPGPGVKALIIYPMNALANDQVRRLARATANTSVTFGLFIGSTSERERNAIRRDPPDILITNYVMLDWMLTRSKDRRPVFEASRDTLKYIVLDEIHIYRGNKATHLKYLLARLKALLSGHVVQIGTSATLQTSHTEGYLKDDSSCLDDFIGPLLDVEDYRFIEPDYEPEPDVGASGQPFLTPSAPEGLGWALEVDTVTGLDNLGQLTGQTYMTMDLVSERAPDKFSQTKPFQDLQQNVFITRLRQVLSEKGAQSFVELVRLLRSLLPPSYPAHNAEEIVKAYLSAVAFVNHKSEKEGQPLLDFRVHLFLRDIGGYLKKCIKCQRYHSGNQDFCQDCGFPLFCVCRHNIRQCIGKVSGNKLKWELRPESDDKKNSYYVLMSSVGPDSDGEDVLGFRENVRLSEDEIILDYDAYGRLRLELLPTLCYDDVYRQIIPLIDGTQRHQYLHNLVESVLDFQPHGQKKLLGFIDNREKATQYVAVLKDEFASQFLKEYLKLCCPLGRKVDLMATLEILHRHIPSHEGLSLVEQALFDELDLWYWRYVCTLPRLFESKKGLLQLRGEERFAEFERELLEVFITERAIQKTYQDDRPDSRYIKFRKHFATDRKGIHCMAAERSEDPKHPSISLGKQAYEVSSQYSGVESVLTDF